VLEIFPKKYAIDFFATLAAASGVTHRFFYLSDGDAEERDKFGLLGHSYSNKVSIRAVMP
jgi:hypothetical protein